MPTTLYDELMYVESLDGDLTRRIYMFLNIKDNQSPNGIPLTKDHEYLTKEQKDSLQKYLIQRREENAVLMRSIIRRKPIAWTYYENTVLKTRNKKNNQERNRLSELINYPSFPMLKWLFSLSNLTATGAYYTSSLFFSYFGAYAIYKTFTNLQEKIFDPMLLDSSALTALISLTLLYPRYRAHKKELRKEQLKEAKIIDKKIEDLFSKN